MPWQWEPTEKIWSTGYTISIRWSLLGGCPNTFPSWMCVSHATWSPATTNSPLPLIRQYTGSASGPYQSKTATSGSGPALHIILCILYRYTQTHAPMHTRTHRDTDVCMDGCTHNVSWYYIIAGDKWRIIIVRMSFTSDCNSNLRDVFSNFFLIQTHSLLYITV